MERHPDLNRALARDHIAALLDNAARARRTGAPRIPAWRRTAGAALVRLGEAILGDPRTAALRTATVFR